MHDYLCKNVWIKREKEESFLFFSLSVSAHIFDVDDWWCGCEYPSGLEDQGLNLLDILDLPSLSYFASKLFRETDPYFWTLASGFAFITDYSEVWRIYFIY